MKKTISVGILGVSGYGGGELLRYLARHPNFRLVYAAGHESAGRKLHDLFPWMMGVSRELHVEKWDAGIAATKTELLFVSLPTGYSKGIGRTLPDDIRIVDLGGDHRLHDDWAHGFADIYPDKIRTSKRVANPGCYPTAIITALAPLLMADLIDPKTIAISALSGMSGTGRGGKSANGYSDVNEAVQAYGFHEHVHTSEIHIELQRFTKKNILWKWTPHYVPMTRGIYATCFADGTAYTDDYLSAASRFFNNRPFVHVTKETPSSKWATGTNHAFVSYVANRDRRYVTATVAIDNLGKGAAGQAIQNANLMFGLEETAGLEQTALWP